jgi:hypothetical protein
MSIGTKLDLIIKAMLYFRTVGVSFCRFPIRYHDFNP